MRTCVWRPRRPSERRRRGASAWLSGSSRWRTGERCLRGPVPSPPSWSWIRMKTPRCLSFRCTGTWWPAWSRTRWTVSLSPVPLCFVLLKNTSGASRSRAGRGQTLPSLRPIIDFCLLSPRSPVHVGLLLRVSQEDQVLAWVRMYTGALHGPGKDAAGNQHPRCPLDSCFSGLFPPRPS